MTMMMTLKNVNGDNTRRQDVPWVGLIVTLTSNSCSDVVGGGRAAAAATSKEVPKVSATELSASIQHVMQSI